MFATLASQSRRLRALWTLLIAVPAPAAEPPVPVKWVDWTRAQSLGNGEMAAAGTIYFQEANVRVDYSGESPGVLLGFHNELWWYYPPAGNPYAQTGLPDWGDGVRVAGGVPTPHVLRFSRPVLDPVFAVTSMGSLEEPVRWTFDATPVLLSEGGLSTGCQDNCLQLEGRTLRGAEGSGVLMFPGVYTDLVFWTWDEEWATVFTVGARALAPVPESSGALMLGAGLLALALGRRRGGIAP